MSSTPRRASRDQFKWSFITMKVIRFLSFSGLAVLGGFFVLFIVANWPGDSKSTVSAADAAEIGDTVTLKYEGVEIICANKHDADTIYRAGEIAVRQSYRLEQSVNVSKMVQARADARKIAMVGAYSCQWSPLKARYLVVHKEITIDLQQPVAKYCLRPLNGDRCWWIERTATSYSQLNRIATGKS
jgi:hypothetical protein